VSDHQQPATPGGQAADAGPMGAIEVKSSFFVLAFLLYLFPAKATINGSAELSQGWGTQVYTMPPGSHQVRVWCPYFFMFKMGDATHVVDVHPGQATVVEWKCPWLVFLPGSWVNLGMRPLDVNTLPEGPGHAATMPAPPAGLAPGTGPVQPVATAGPPEPAAAPAAAAATPAGWHADPHGQAALRYWDGAQWTEHTSDGQATAG
jgi:hypothetical protein